MPIDNWLLFYYANYNNNNNHININNIKKQNNNQEKSTIIAAESKVTDKDRSTGSIPNLYNINHVRYAYAPPLPWKKPHFEKFWLKFL